MDINNQDMKKAARMAQKLKGKSDNEIIRELANMIKSGEGGISPDRAEQMISMFLPMVNQEQRNKLERLLKEIKNS